MAYRDTPKTENAMLLQDVPVYHSTKTTTLTPPQSNSSPPPISSTGYNSPYQPYHLIFK